MAIKLLQLLNIQKLSNRYQQSPSTPTSVVNQSLIQKASRVIGLALLLNFNLAEVVKSIPLQGQVASASFVGSGVTFSCEDSEATIKSRNAPSVKFGNRAIYIGYQQVGSTNKDPIVIRFDNGVKLWCRTDYETTGDDGTGYGLLYGWKSDGSTVLYGVFSSTGTQGGNDFRRFATNGWLTNYGSGGGAKVAVLAKINIGNGTVTNATFLSAKLSDGRSNSLLVKGLSWTGTTVVVQADSWYSPRKRDTNPMTCSGASPFNYTVEFSPDLKTMLLASADRCF